MRPQKLLEELGYDLSRIRDATVPLEFEVPDDPAFIKGCVIGNPCACTGAKAVLEIKGVEWCWIGVKKAYVAFVGGEVLRYVHDGVIPKAQDNLTMPPPGTYKLRPPTVADRLGSGRKAGKRDGSRPNRSSPPIVASRAGMMRR
jgi:hypothetical protein